MAIKNNTSCIYTKFDLLVKDYLEVKWEIVKMGAHEARIPYIKIFISFRKFIQTKEVVCQ